MIEMQAQFNGQLSAGMLLELCGLGNDGEVQKAIDRAVIDYMVPYWAYDTGKLAESAYKASDIGSGLIVYPGPHAHYMAMGEVYGPSYPITDSETGDVTGFFSPPGQSKEPTGRPIKYNTSHSPLAGAFPFERMIADHKEDIVEEVRRVAGHK